LLPQREQKVPYRQHPLSYTTIPLLLYFARLEVYPTNHEQQEGQGGFYHRHVVFTSTGASQMLPSCQMGLITLALAFAMGLQFGLLACIGFLVFAGIARVVTFLINIQLAVQGRPLNPLFLQILSWFCCWSLVAWLAS